MCDVVPILLKRRTVLAQRMGRIEAGSDGWWNLQREKDDLDHLIQTHSQNCSSCDAVRIKTHIPESDDPQ